MTVLALLLLAVSAFAQDKLPVDIPASAAAPADQVRGLRMEFYPFDPNAPKGLDSLDEAMTFVFMSQPQLSELLDVPAVDFPKNARTAPDTVISLGDYFFGAQAFAARKASLPARMSAPIGPRSVFVLRGFFNVEKPGSYNFRFPVDDGAEVKIGGQVVLYQKEYGGMFPDADPKYAATVNFSKAGVYAIRITHWDRGQELGIHVYSDLTAAQPGAFVLLPILTGTGGSH